MQITTNSYIFMPHYFNKLIHTKLRPCLAPASLSNQLLLEQWLCSESFPLLHWSRILPPNSSLFPPALHSQYCWPYMLIMLEIKLKKQELKAKPCTNIYIYTVSRESAPRAENLESGVSWVSSGNASWFLTISQTFRTVSGLACRGFWSILIYSIALTL